MPFEKNWNHFCLGEKELGVVLRTTIGVLSMQFWVMRTGAPWRDLPPDLGGWSNTHRRFIRWRDSVWERLAQGEHFAEQVLKKANGPGIVGIDKGGASHVFQPPVVQAASGSGQAAQAVTHGAPCGKLDESHSGELLLEVEFTR